MEEIKKIKKLQLKEIKKTFGNKRDMRESSSDIKNVVGGRRNQAAKVRSERKS